MTKSWDDMTSQEKLEALWWAIGRICDTQNALNADLNTVWGELKAARAELGKNTKDVATLRALWPKNYSRVG